MRTLILLIVAAALGACASNPSMTSAPARDSGVIVSATLAPFGSFEWTIAPDYTRLATTRRQAARALRNGRISVATAEQVQVEADAARAALDEALVTDKRAQDAAAVARNELDDALATADLARVDVARAALDEALSSRAVADSLVVKARASIARAAALLGDAR